MIKLTKTLAAALAVLLLAVLLPRPCLPALAEDLFDPIGQTFHNVHAPYMTEGGLPSETDFFTEADLAANRITILNLWDSACLFCRLELPYFQQISEEYADSGVRVVGVSSTRMGGTYPAAYEYLIQYGVTYTNLIPDDGLKEIMFRNANTPQTFFVDETGTVVDYIGDDTTYEELTQKLYDHLAMPGDADCNGVLSFSDISTVYGYLIAGAQLTKLGRLNADVDQSGDIGFNDVSTMYVMLVG